MREARIGERYQKIEGVRSVWEVLSVETDLNGIRHCHIVDVIDRTNSKLIAEAILTKRRLYRLVAAPVVAHGEVE